MESGFSEDLSSGKKLPPLYFSLEKLFKSFNIFVPYARRRFEDSVAVLEKRAFDY